MKIVKEFKNENSLIISKMDKGNGCVLMNKSDYLGKMNVIICHSTKFKLLGSAKELDNIDKVESEIIKFLKQFNFFDFINKTMFHSFELNHQLNKFSLK